MRNEADLTPIANSESLEKLDLRYNNARIKPIKKLIETIRANGGQVIGV
jgi:hypothetical protein